MRNHDKHNHVIAHLLKASAAISISVFLAACGDDSSKTSGGSVEDQEVVAISDKTVSGVSQKGPFVNGSSVTVQELDGATLAQTGLGFEGKIKNDLGEFSIKVKSLQSQYALLKANGFYRNEVTGEKSKSQVTLYALTDLSNRDEVNVNLLTHLEYERSLYLAADDSVTVASAKKQAESEVLASFGIRGEFANAEDLNIFGNDDESAALLAISILMQGELNEADFSERLNNYATDIETDGKWDDSKTATKIADWASENSLNRGLSKIRRNIVGWGLASDVPTFEKYVDNFWWENYGLGVCNDEREGAVLKNDNSLSGKYDIYFICEKGAWRIASDTEYDTYQQKCDEDGIIVFGNVNKDYAYDCDVQRWRHASNVEAALGGCVEKRFDEVAETESVYYICQNRKWRKATDIEKDTYGWEIGKDADAKNGDVVRTNCYVFENSAWRSGNASDCSLGLRGCTALRRDTVGEGGDNAWYKCVSETWRTATDIEKDTATWGAGEFDGEIRAGQVNETIYYIYETGKNSWRNATTLEKDTYKRECSEDGKYFYGNENTSTKYVCDNTAFRTLNNVELEADSACTSYNLDEYYVLPKYDGLTNYSYYKCTASGWTFTTEKLNQGTLTDERDDHVYKTIGIKSQMWMAENLNYADSANYPSMLERNWCYDKEEENCVKYGRLYMWCAAIDSVYWSKQGKTCSHHGDLCGLPDKVQGICPTGWHVPTNVEFNTLFAAVGGSSIAGKMLKSQTGWNSEKFNGTDAYGFSALPAGYRYYDGRFYGEGDFTSFWSATKDSYDAYRTGLDGYNDNARLNDDIDDDYAFSVRCVKDNEE